ncbi:hypothetical protein EOT10_39625 [Streptomyces antnestii]|uniref:Uncharacterized protein n=1 Tax=Streptomyces antnestii TaxID=2494256 RepID=A0A437NZ15_9ACTN|nr:hypothetical protein [Streptomyces sp. San01]RVU15269.1 hypothetical protein EOT10_39625 [Streptomyces sp. San01]
MGFSGELVFGRSGHPLLSASVFDGIDQSKDTVHVSWPRVGGWQTLQFGGDVIKKPEATLRALVEWTGALACVASVYDSDVAMVMGLGPEGELWEACLNLEKAAGLWAEVPDDVDDMSEWISTPAFAEAVDRKRAELDAHVSGDAQGALDWARSAGFAHSVTVASVQEVLRSGEVFVEELFDALLDRLGFPEAVDPESQR